MKRAPLTFALGFAFAAAVGLGAPIARADDPIAAEATFAKGRALMKSGNYAEACAAFELSFSLERAVGTELNLAECYVKVGRSASAWLAYRDAAALAQSAGQTARATEARERAAKLEPGLCRLVVKVPADAPSEMIVRRDKTPIDRLLWGVAVPVDPGPHTISATFGGEQEVGRSVTIEPPKPGEPCAETVIELPARHEGPTPPVVAPKPTPAPTPVVAPLAERAPEPPPNTSGSRGTVQRGVAIGMGALGVVALGVGTAFTADAISKKSAAGCTEAGCTQVGRTQMRSAGSSADVSSVAFTSGLVLLAAGTVLWLTAPTAKPPATAFAF